MHFGNSPRTAETERRMALWRETHPDATTSEYNRAYEATWAGLTDFSSEEVDRDAEFIEAVRPYREAWEAREEIRAALAPKVPRKPLRPKHRTQTKGAFGKGKR